MDSPFLQIFMKKRPSNLGKPWKSQRAMIYGLPPVTCGRQLSKKIPLFICGNTTNRTLLWLGCNCRESKQKHVLHVSDFYNKNNVLKHQESKGRDRSSAAKFIVCVSREAFNFSIFIYKQSGRRRRRALFTKHERTHVTARCQKQRDVATL